MRKPSLCRRTAIPPPAGAGFWQQWTAAYAPCPGG
jgi:hypothetical protein